MIFQSFKLLIITALISSVPLISTGCALFMSPDSDYGIFEPHRPFYATKVDGSYVTYSINATLLAYSDHAIVYAEDGHGISGSTAQDIAHEFEDHIYDVVRDNFAHESDVDGNGRIILLLLDIVDGYSGSGGFVAGYFDPDNALYNPTSNKADMIYLDVNPLVPGSTGFYDTTAHEFQHLVNFSETYLRSGGNLQDLWINEGLSSAAEYLYARTHNMGRINYYNSDSTGSISDGNNFFVWRGDDLLADYSTVYIFFQWMRIQASNGSAIYREILESPYMNYQAVLDAMNSRVYSGAVNWERIVGDWYLSILLNKSTGLYGFENEFSLTPHFITGENATASLFPGEGVFDVIPGSYTPDLPVPADSHYTAVTSGSDDLDSTEPYTGDVLLAWNGSSNNSSTSSIDIPISAALVEMPSSFKTLSLSASVVSGPTLPKSYPIGVHFTNPHSGRLIRDDE